MVDKKWIRRSIFALIAIWGLGMSVSLLSLVETQGKKHQPNAFDLQLEDYDFFIDLPITSWAPSCSINTFLKSEIQDAYTQGIKLLDQSRNTASNSGLPVYFTNHFIGTYQQQGNSLLPYRSHLQHNLSITHINKDQSWVQLIDSTIVSFSDYSTQWFQQVNQVIIELTDEGWKIDEITILGSNEIQNTYVQKRKSTLQRGVNYYPSEFSWLEFWSNYPRKIVQNDLEVINEMGFDHVRIFIPYQRNVHQDLINDIRHFYKTCDQLNINVITTLFDFPTNYINEAYSNHFKYLTKIHSSAVGTQQPKLYDIKNEPDLDFELHGRKAVQKWLAFIIDGLNLIAPNIPLTIGWSQSDYVETFSNKLDLLSFHFYKDLSEFHKWQTVYEDSLSKPLLISEFGFPGCASDSWIWPEYSDQEEYVNQMIKTFSKHNIAHTLWCYADFQSVPRYVFGWNPRTRKIQGSYGIISTDGKVKYSITE